MVLNLLDILVFCACVAGVVSLSMYKSRREKASEDYFLAGRGLTWPPIGLSIVAANLSTEQFVGMASPDQAYPTLIRSLIPSGLRGFMFAAIAGAVITRVVLFYIVFWWARLYRISCQSLITRLSLSGRDGKGLCGSNWYQYATAARSSCKGR